MRHGNEKIWLPTLFASFSPWSPDQFSSLHSKKVIFAFPLLKVVDGTNRTVQYSTVFSSPLCQGTLHTESILKGGVKAQQTTDWSEFALWYGISLLVFFLAVFILAACGLCSNTVRLQKRNACARSECAAKWERVSYRQRVKVNKRCRFSRPWSQGNTSAYINVSSAVKTLIMVYLGLPRILYWKEFGGKSCFWWRECWKWYLRSWIMALLSPHFQ